VYFGNLNPTTGAVDTDTYRANGPYDPDYAAGGGQPYGYDQCAAFFERYTVLNSRIKVTAWSQTGAGSGTGTANGMVFVLLSADATAPTTLEDAIGQMGTCHVTPIGSQDGNRGVVVVNNSFNARKFFSTPDPTTNGQIGGLYNGNPDLQAFFHVGYSDASSGVDAAIITFCVEISYDMVWYGRRQVTSS
jgi:hypothetical protein